MEIDNIDAFNITAMEIFQQSLSCFPIPVNIDSIELAKVVIEFFETPKNNSDFQDTFSFLTDTADETLNWLHFEGFIRKCNSDSFGTTIVLTSKGLNAVNGTPSSVDDKKSFKEIFKLGLTNTTVATVAGVMVEFFKASS
ncbi:hypothetical protein GCM10009111_23490 [Colwellia asteriadis]|uniref:Uncharacterized protein n=1 Tax=Colwellia asteriadis TaxID=517723 RepID=A0ABN1L8Z9_9GAMM